MGINPDDGIRRAIGKFQQDYTTQSPHVILVGTVYRYIDLNVGSICYMSL